MLTDFVREITLLCTFDSFLHSITVVFIIFLSVDIEGLYKATVSLVAGSRTLFNFAGIIRTGTVADLTDLIGA